MIRELEVTDLAQELKDKQIQQHDAQIYDVRDNCAYVQGHIVGAKNHPVNEGLNRSMIDNTEGTLYVLCGGGSKAPKAAQILHEMDNSRDIVILTGGTRAAKAAGMPIIEGDSAC